MVRGRKPTPRQAAEKIGSDIPELEQEVGPDGATTGLPPIEDEIDQDVEVSTEGEREDEEIEALVKEAGLSTKKKRKGKKSAGKGGSSGTSAKSKDKGKKRQRKENLNVPVVGRLQEQFESEKMAEETKVSISSEAEKRLSADLNLGLTVNESSLIASKISAKSTLEAVLAKENYILQEGEIDEILRYTEKRPDKGVDIIPYFLDGYRAGLVKVRAKKETEMVKIVEAMSTCLKEQKEQAKVQTKQITELKSLLQAERSMKKEETTLVNMPKSVTVPTTKVKKGAEILDVESDEEDDQEADDDEEQGPAAKLLASLKGKKRAVPETKTKPKDNITRKSQKTDSKGKGQVKVEASGSVAMSDEDVDESDENEKKYEYYKNLMGFTEQRLEELCHPYRPAGVFLYICSGKVDKYWDNVRTGRVKKKEARELIGNNIATYVSQLKMSTREVYEDYEDSEGKDLDEGEDEEDEDDEDDDDGEPEDAEDSEEGDD